jgi:hypothetical protein
MTVDRKIAFILVVFAAGLLGCKEDSGKEKLSGRELIGNPATASNEQGIDPNAPLPKFEFEELNHDFGTVLSGDKVNHVFKFKNTGNAPLVIQNASASCGCTVPDWPKSPIPAGGTGEIKVEFDTKGKSGFQTKVVTIVANTNPNTTNLEIRGQVNTVAAEKPAN